MAALVEPAVSVRGLVKRYGGRAVVDGVTFDVARGEVLALLGPNGAGKTTTVEILEGYRTADGGDVRVLGCDPARHGQVLKPRIGLMLQQGGVYPQARPLETLQLFASFFRDPEDPRALLHRVGLEDSVRTRYRQLSGGQKQRLSLALALVGKPEVVFLDEPTAAMDPQARRATWEVIQDLKARHVTVLLTTHYLEEAERLADRVAIIHRGHLVALDTPERLARSGAGEEVRFSAQPGLDIADLQAYLAEAGATHVTETDAGRYAVAGQATPHLIAALASWMAGQRVLIRELAVARHPLEEVYLRLTADTALSVSDGAAEERAA